MKVSGIELIRSTVIQVRGRMKHSKIHECVTSNVDKQILFFRAQQPNAGQSLLIFEVSRAHTVTHHSR